jgi:hypothetical protein
MKTYSKAFLAVLPLFLAACSFTPVKPEPVAMQEQPPIKQAAHQFIAALASGDEAAISRATTVAGDPAAQRLAASVRKDTAVSRQLQMQLARRFDAGDDLTTAVGSDVWLDNFKHLAEDAVMLKVDQRARIGDETTDGVVFLRQVNGEWKVELIPTLVAESGGRITVPDADVLYRFDVAAALNEMLLQRLERDEFTSYHDYQRARNQFWAQYLTIISNGEEPHDKLLATLPYLPREPMFFVNTK